MDKERILFIQSASQVWGTPRGHRGFIRIFSHQINSMTKYIIVLFFILFYPKDGLSQVQIGQSAPSIHVDEWLDNPWLQKQDLSGKAIVLDFWFTQCAPCIYTIPHLNELAKSYENEEIVFLSITFESKEEVVPFITRKKMLSNIGTDTSYATIEAFGVEGYPQTFLIDKEGILRWAGHPSHLNAQQIDLLIDKEYYPTIESNTNQSASGITEIDKLVLPATIAVNDYMKGGSGWQSNSTEFSVVNKPLKEIFSHLLGKSEHRIITSDTNRYDVLIKIPADLENRYIRSVLANSIMSELSIELFNKEEVIEGYQLRIGNDGLFIKNAINPDVQYYGLSKSVGKEYWSAKGAQISDLIMALESRFEVSIEDDTQLFGFFEFEFPIASFREANQYLLKEYGLEFTPSEIKTEISILQKGN